MQYTTQQALVAMDHEGRERIGAFFVGDKVTIVDARGRVRKGQILKLFGGSVLLRNHEGAEISIGYRYIDRVEVGD